MFFSLWSQFFPQDFWRYFLLFNSNDFWKFMLHFNMSCKIIVRKSCKGKGHIKLCYFFCLEDIYIYIYIYIYMCIYIYIHSSPETYIYIYIYIPSKCFLNSTLTYLYVMMLLHFLNISFLICGNSFLCTQG